MARPIRIVPLLGALLLVLNSGPVGADEKRPEPKNVVIIGASSMNGLPELSGALLESNKTPMKVERSHFARRDLELLWKSKKVWDYVIMDAWQFTRGDTGATAFPDAVAAFVKEARAHSPQCRIILFPWWLASERATN